jgi:hypothetical protein
MKVHEKGAYHAVEVIPVGKKRQFRITADHGNWINEKLEDNNQKKIIWPARILKDEKSKKVKIR